MNAYWQRLIALRNSADGAVFRIGGEVPEDHYQWFTPENDQLLGYVAGDVLVLMNTSWDAATFDISALPAGTWTQVSDGTLFTDDGCECIQAIESSGPTDDIIAFCAYLDPLSRLTSVLGLSDLLGRRDDCAIKCLAVDRVPVRDNGRLFDDPGY